MIVHNEVWNGIPLLHVTTEEMDSNSPTLIFLHGHTSAKEHNLHYAYQLVKQGVRVILPDALYHGERDQQLSELELTLKFWDIVLNSVEEIEKIVSYGVVNGIINDSKIGLAGTSMGAIVTSAALTKYSWIKCAAICMGVTSLSKLAKVQFEQYSKTMKNLPISKEQYEAYIQYLQSFDLENMEFDFFNHTPIIFWHGKNDLTVPINLSYPFYEKHLQHTKAKFIVDEQAAHQVNRKGLLEVTSFLAHYLS